MGLRIGIQRTEELQLQFRDQENSTLLFGMTLQSIRHLQGCLTGLGQAISLKTPQLGLHSISPRVQLLRQQDSVSFQEGMHGILGLLQQHLLLDQLLLLSL